MSNLCPSCGWTAADLKLVDVGDDLLLVCSDCETGVAVA